MPAQPGSTRRIRSESALGWMGAMALVVVVYAAVVRGGGLLIDATASPHLGLSVLATAVVALTIEPTRLWVERRTRRLTTARRLPYDVLAEFTSTMTRSLSGGSIPVRMAEALADGLAVDWAEVWLMVNQRLTLVATYPPRPGGTDDPPMSAGGEDQDGRRSVNVAYRDHLLAVLRVQECAGRPLTLVEERLFAGLAAQAGLVLRSAQVRAELTARREELEEHAAELRRTRDLLVDAEDQERRRLERDLHDGAQQQLVALGIHLRLARELAASSPGKAAEVLAEQSDAAETAIENLVALCRGARPRVLLERGLDAALRAATGASAVPAELQVADVGRLPPDIEVAVYFCCLEALQNTAKHAQASHVTVDLALVGPGIRLTVVDNGVGCRPGGREGSGLSNMRQRVEPLGGRVDIDSRPGWGTAVAVVLPTHAPNGQVAG
jgi:signal transduction histidine kinase